MSAGIVGKLMACYGPHKEPRIVVVLGVSSGDECLVRIANANTTTGARLEYLREFNMAEFYIADSEYWRDEYAIRSSQCAKRVAEYQEFA